MKPPVAPLKSLSRPHSPTALARVTPSANIDHVVLTRQARVIPKAVLVVALLDARIVLALLAMALGKAFVCRIVVRTLGFLLARGLAVPALLAGLGRGDWLRGRRTRWTRGRDFAADVAGEVAHGCVNSRALGAHRLAALLLACGLFSTTVDVDALLEGDKAGAALGLLIVLSDASEG